MNPLVIVFLVLLVLSGVGLIIFILMHSGKGTGISDMIASSMYSTQTGTCIIEMPDEIIDASAGTQLSNIRDQLAEIPLPLYPAENHRFFSGVFRTEFAAVACAFESFDAFRHLYFRLSQHVGCL